MHLQDLEIYEHDSRVRVAENTEQLSLFRNRRAENVNGILIPYIVNADIATIADLVTARQVANLDLLRGRNGDIYHEHPAQIFKDIRPATSGKALDTARWDLLRFFHNATGKFIMPKFQSGMRAAQSAMDNTLCISLGIHGPAADYYNQDGQPYSVAPNHIFISENIKITAPQEESTSDEYPHMRLFAATHADI